MDCTGVALVLDISLPAKPKSGC